MPDDYIDPQGQGAPQRRSPPASDFVPVGGGQDDFVPVEGAATAPEQPSIGQSLWEGLLHGVGNIGMGARQLGARIPGMAGVTGETPQAADAAAQQRVQQYRGPFAPGQGQPLTPARANPISAGIGEFAGEGLATVPLMGGALGAGARLGTRALMGSLQGGTAGALTPVVSGRDFWTEKAAQAGLGAAAGGAMGAGGAVLNPRLGADAAAMSQRGVSLTPGMRMGMQESERVLQAFPILRGYIEGKVGRSVDDFNRAAVRQALEPIGAVMPRSVKPGHDMITFMKDKISDAYDHVLPMLAPVDRSAVDATLRASPELQKLIGEMASDDARRFQAMISNRILDRFDPTTGAMDGTLFKKVDRDLGDRAVSLAHGNKEISDGLVLANQILRDEVKKANPTLSGYLDNIDHAWAMSVRLDKAASRRADSEAKFTPSDMLMAIKDSDASRNHTAFAKGDALMQAFAEQSNRVLGSSVDKYPPLHWGALTAGQPFGAGGRAIYQGADMAQRHPSFGMGVTGGVPAMGAGAGSIVSRSKREDDKKPRVPTSGP